LFGFAPGGVSLASRPPLDPAMLDVVYRHLSDLQEHHLQWLVKLNVVVLEEKA
jgi:hypothetical protein